MKTKIVSANDQIFHDILKLIDSINIGNKHRENFNIHQTVQEKWINLNKKIKKDAGFKIQLKEDFQNDNYLKLFQLEFILRDEEDSIDEYGRHEEIDASKFMKKGVTKILPILKGWPLTVPALFDDESCRDKVFEILSKELKMIGKSRIEIIKKLYKNSLTYFYSGLEYSYEFYKLTGKSLYCFFECEEDCSCTDESEDE